jgi:hypothetical protein
LRFSFLVENAALRQLVKQESELRSLVLASVCVLRATPVTRPAACRSYFGDSSSFNDGPAKRSFRAVKAQEFIPGMHVVIGAEIPTKKNPIPYTEPNAPAQMFSTFRQLTKFLWDWLLTTL